MPYIHSGLRKKYVPVLESLKEAGQIKTAGELNYLITKITLQFLGESPNYQSFNDVMGALEGAKLELYRRKIADYENSKRDENGEVF